MKTSRKAVAVDLGATSGRFAVGAFDGSKISFDVIEQIPHTPIEQDGRLFWDIDALLGLCQRAADYAAKEGAEVLGIDSWGVDHGFIDESGELIQSPVCYRDKSHEISFGRLAEHRNELYRLTGVQHQPFNTICQLLARVSEEPDFAQKCQFLLLPDLLGYLLSGEIFYEQTEASTTQLMGVDGKWSEAAFKLIGWPVPSLQPGRPGTIGGYVRPKVKLAHVGSHDTASAVAGFGALKADQVFANIGTWSLSGCVIDQPIANAEAEAGNFTNEWTVDGRVRLLKNIPGFYVINRLHEELGIQVSVPEWLKTGVLATKERVNLMHECFFNPTSMKDACSAQLRSGHPQSREEWAGLALASLSHTVAKLPAELSLLTGRQFKEFRIGGGGSQSETFCQSLANESGLRVIAGPSEATVLGNLAAQFLALGVFDGWGSAYKAIENSTDRKVYEPG